MLRVDWFLIYSAVVIMVVGKEGQGRAMASLWIFTHSLQNLLNFKNSSIFSS